VAATKTKQGYKLIKWYFGKEIEFPSEWDVVKLKDVCTQITDGVHATPKYQENGIPFLSVNNIENEKLDFSNCKYISREAHKEFIKRCHPEKGDVLLSKIGTLGIADEIDFDREFSIFVQLALLKLNKTKINSTYLKNTLNFTQIRNRIQSCAAGTTLRYIGIGSISNLLIFLPNLIEQQKIASILSNVDSFIESYDKIILSTKKLKKGLMQQLLTKGIGHTKFKKVKSFFGKYLEIPNEWEYPKFSQIIQVNPSTKITEKTVPYIPMDAVDIEKPHINYYEERELDSHSNLSKFQENDVLFARITPSTENGKTCIIENFSRKGIVSSELTVLRPSEKVVPRYLYYYVKNHRIRQFAISQMMGTTGRQRVPDKVFKEDLSFELPLKSEQQKIASILSEVDNQTNQLENNKSNLLNVKKGLMEKLLTGQIRVKI